MNIFQFLKTKLTNAPATLTPGEINQVKTDKISLDLLKKFGIVQSELHKAISDTTLINWERQGVYQSVDRCFTGDTKVALLDGRDIEMTKLVEEQAQGKVNYVYSIDLKNQKIVRSPIKKAWKIGEDMVMKVTLDNNKDIKCTLDHKFMLRDGTYREAKDLVPGDSLMPLYREINNSSWSKGYWKLFDPISNRWHIQYSYFNPHKPKFNVVHHCFANFYEFDLNKLDDTPENHEIMDIDTHKELHRNLCRSGKEHWVIKLKTENYAEYLNWCKKIGVTRRANMVPAWNVGQTKETNASIARAANTATGRKRPIEESKRYLVKLIQRNNKLSQQDAEERYNLIRSGIPCPQCGESMHPDRKTCSYSCKAKYNQTQLFLNKQLKNHKVKSIEFLNKVESVYCLEIEPNHNFALSAGVFVANCLAHPLMCAAVGLYADYASTPSQLFNSTVWVTTENREYQYQIEKLFDVINLEEIVYDWLWTMATFGDLFVQVHGQPGVGIVSISDDQHPINVSRVDYQGRLVGFYETPLGYASPDERKLLPPWEYVHGRLLGAKKRRSQHMDSSFTEFRTISIMTPDDRRLTSKYGTSILLDALPTWKRLRLAEDSVLMARINRGVLRYIYKIAVGENQNPEAVASLVDNYVEELKRARCVRGDTKISLMDGREVAIKDICDNKDHYIGKYVWTVNESTRQLEPKPILNCFKTVENAEMVRVHLDNEQHIDCTPDHLFMLRDGTYSRAEYLQSGQSLMPMYKKPGKNGYQDIYEPNDDKWRPEYILATQRDPLLSEQYVKGMHIHHKDFNKKNNDLSNFRVMTKDDHFALHHANIWNKGLSKETDERVARSAEKLSETLQLQHELGLRETWNKGLTSEADSRVAGIATSLTGQPRSQEAIENQKRTRKENYDNGKRYLRVARELRDCICGCGQKFECKVNSKKRFYSKSCQHSSMPRSEQHGNSIAAAKKGVAFTDDHKSKLKASQIEVKCITCDVCGDQWMGNAPSLTWHKRKNHKALLNHKVVRVERLSVREDTYDLTIKDNHNFPVAAGVFIHNSLDTTQGASNYQDRFNAMSNMEDIIIPVWGTTNNVEIAKIGGEVDIKWIVDIEELRNQLATALRVPLGLLSGYSKEGNSGGLGSDSVARMDIRFARQARRLQRSLINMLTRMVQIHLSYQGIDPDLNLFKIQMTETSTAEEMELSKALDTSVQTVDKVADLVMKCLGEVETDKKALLDYLNKKFLKLNDMDIEKLILKGNPNAFKENDRTLPVAGLEGSAGSEQDKAKADLNKPNPFREGRTISDLHSMRPLKESMDQWSTDWGNKTVKVTPIAQPT